MFITTICKHSLQMNCHSDTPKLGSQYFCFYSIVHMVHKKKTKKQKKNTGCFCINDKWLIQHVRNNPMIEEEKERQSEGLIASAPESGKTPQTERVAVQEVRIMLHSQYKVAVRLLWSYSLCPALQNLQSCSAC